VKRVSRSCIHVKQKFDERKTTIYRFVMFLHANSVVQVGPVTYRDVEYLAATEYSYHVERVLSSIAGVSNDKAAILQRRYH